MKISKSWTNEERLYAIAACATFTLNHIKKGGRYGEMGTPNMEAIRIISVEDPAQLELARRDVESFIRRSRLKGLPDLAAALPEVRINLICACATKARDHAMAGGTYGAAGVPTMNTILLLATGSLQYLFENMSQITSYVHGVEIDLRSGLQAFDETVAMVDKAMSAVGRAN